MSTVPAEPALRSRAIGIIATGTILAILYFARDVLVPITLAVILSLLLSPLVRALRHLGLGATSSVIAAALVLTLACGAVAGVIGVQAARMAASVPQYERTLRHKFAKLNELTVDRLAAFTSQTERIIGDRVEPKAAEAPPTETPAAALSAPPAALSAPPPPSASSSPSSSASSSASSSPSSSASSSAPIPVVLRQPALTPLQVGQRVLASIWVPLETAGIVLVVLVFVLLERESVRDRLIRIAGGTDLRATTLVLNDAGERLSRFFVSQFAVNLGVGLALWVGLAVIGLPHATLWAALAAVLRFVPYIGVWIAALFAATLAAAVDPGWSLVIITICLFLCVELIAGQLIEPQLYGHTTGLSPLSVVVAAIFWSWLWGPVGLVVSTPLTLCLVVVGRHVRALSLLDILLGDSQALTMPERFYQRALSADSDELIAQARGYLKHNTLAEYGDFVLMPALRLTMFDLEHHMITSDQQLKVRRTVVAVIGALDGARRRFALRRDAVSVLDQMSAGRLLRQQREALFGPWQGPMVVPPGSVMICLSMGSILDDIGAELLVRALRDKKLDARHVSLEDLDRTLPPETTTGGVSMVYVVSATSDEQRKGAEAAAERARQRFPGAYLVGVLLPGPTLQPEPTIDTIRGADESAASFVEAMQICRDWLEERTKT
jgi:predicted PurR-regulated permease PerM